MHFVYLAEEAGIETADTFLACAEQTVEELAQMPMMGTPVVSRRAELAGVRKWRVRNYENVLLFYIALPDRIEILRAIHAARDWASILGL
jgi:toxin ParE1/3/4